uniref:Uncharacterized protein n=1 Tax=Myripristis murdjan TaxID=586833 RepID=A0A667Z1U0_9TELE
MQCGSLVGDVLSPESTVSALLSSSGHLRSSLVPERNATFTYRDKDYTSASEALDAYIADFEQSHGAGESAAGRLVLPGRRHAGATGPRTAPRNRDVLRERLTDRELDFLTLPVSSLRHRGNRDRLSMTTEELLSIPCDGSMPVTHTSAFLRGLVWPLMFLPLFNLFSCRPPPQVQRRSRRSRHVETRLPCFSPEQLSGEKTTAADGHVGLERPLQAAAAAASSSLHFPRWFTSHKSEMNFSGVSSVPELTYPTWIHSCEDHEPGGVREFLLIVVCLCDICVCVCVCVCVCQTEHQQTLRALRLQFAEQISLVASDRKQSDVMDSLFRGEDARILFQTKNILFQTKNILFQTKNILFQTKNILFQTKNILFRHESKIFCLDMRVKYSAGGSWCSSRKLPGPVEALKQMMFRLQAVEAELQRQQHTHPASAHTHPAAAHTHPASAHTHPYFLKVILSTVCDLLFVLRALQHLETLRSLVDEEGGRGGAGPR